MTSVPVACALQPMSGLKTPQANGSSVVRAPLSRPQSDSAVSGGSGAGDRPKPVIADITELTLLDQYELTPERVKAYSIEGNSIHYEQEAAERARFRAPLIGGGMGFII